MNKKPRYWFVSRKYGWGWTPATWEGWLVFSIYLIYVISDVTLTSYAAYSDQDVLRLIPCTILATGLLIWVCYKTGEKPRWRWGK